MPFQFVYHPFPGIFTDVIKLLSLKLNSKKHWLSTLSGSKDLDSYINTLEQEVLRYPDFPPELALFVYTRRGKSVYFLTHIFSVMLRQKDFSSLSFASFQEYLQDIPTVKNDLLSYYLGEQNYSDVDCEPLIRCNTDIPDRIKIYLLGFLLKPSAYIATLQKSIQLTLDLLQKTHNYSADAAIINEDIINWLLKTFYPTSPIPGSDTFTYSVCHVISKYGYVDLTSPSPWLIIGSSFESSMDSISNHSIDLSITAHALSDPKRLQILNYLQKHPNCSRQRLLSDLSQTESMLNYNISELKKAGLLSQNKVARSVRYSVNFTAFNHIAQQLLNFTKEEGLL